MSPNKDLFKVRRWMNWMNEDFILIVAVVLGALVIAICVIIAHTRKPSYCEQFANTPQKDLPAQCITYWTHQ